MIEVYEPEPDDEPLPASGHRTYEVYQRERVGETTNLIKPLQLTSKAFGADPYPFLEILRESYPCYRDWAANCFWITRYDDVTSVFADLANYESRSKRWYYAEPDLGRDLRSEVAVSSAWVERIDAVLDGMIDRVVSDLVAESEADLAPGFAARIPLELLMAAFGVPPEDGAEFASRYWRMQRGFSWDAAAQHDGRAAVDELRQYFGPLLERRRSAPGPDVVSAIAVLDPPGGPATAGDVVATLLEADHETLHGALANMWFLLLTSPDQFEVVRAERRMMKFAYLETLRHSPPVLAADVFTRHEVERFGRLLPAGAMLRCSAAAANRDPRQFADPDRFVVDRKDLCQREPRGHYRADGLASGIAFGLGRPSIHPAIPKDRPRSWYAVTRDVAVRASTRLLDATADLRLAPGAEPVLRSLRLGEMRTCWRLPVEIRPR